MNKLKKYFLPSQPRKIFIIFAIVIFSYYFIIYFIIGDFHYYQQSNIQLIDLVFALINACLSICFLYCLAGIGQYYLKVHHIHVLQQQNQFSKEELQKLKLEESEYYNEIVKHQEMIIRLLEDNQVLNQQIKLLENAVYKQNILFCQNGIIDTVIASKACVIDEKGIEFLHTIHMPQHLQITDIDLSTILFNLLDNAIEAYDRITDAHKTIQLEIDYHYHVIKICVKNSFCSNQKKKSEKGHGYGLKIVYDIVKKYNGDIEILDKGNEYITQIYLYEDNKND